MNSSQYTRVEDVLDLNDDNRLWLYIPNFNGYEVSNDGYIRSMKHFRKYPYGILIKPVKKEPYGSSPDPLFELSDNNNERQRIRLSQIMHLAMTNNFSVSGYPRTTRMRDCQSRNDRHFVKKSMKLPPLDKEAKYAKFTIIQEGTEHPKMEYSEPDVHVPVISIKGDEYYGRKDCRAICYFHVQDGPS